MHPGKRPGRLCPLHLYPCWGICSPDGRKCPSPLSTMATHGHPRPSTATHGHPRPSTAIHSHPRPARRPALETPWGHARARCWQAPATALVKGSCTLYRGGVTTCSQSALTPVFRLGLTMLCPPQDEPAGQRDRDGHRSPTYSRHLTRVISAHALPMPQRGAQGLEDWAHLTARGHPAPTPVLAFAPRSRTTGSSEHRLIDSIQEKTEPHLERKS